MEKTVVKAEFMKHARNSELLLSDAWREWRLASVDEVSKRLADIKEIVDPRDNSRLLEGFVGNKYKCLKQYSPDLKHMLLVRTSASRPSDGSFDPQIYSGVKLKSQGREAALLLSCKDKITEVICFVLYSIVKDSEKFGKRRKELNSLTERVQEEFGNDRPLLHYVVDQSLNQKHATYVAQLIVSDFEGGKELIKAEDIYGRTALHFAAFHGNIELCQFLVQQCEMDVAKVDQHGENLLHFAVKGKTEAVFKELCALPGVNNIIFSLDSQRKTALHKAAAQGSIPMITTLLSSISKSEKKEMHYPQAHLVGQSHLKHDEESARLDFIHQEDSFGQTALLEAAGEGHVEAVNILLKNGSDPLRERHYDGRTALHYAVQLPNDEKAKEMTELLLQHYKNDEERSLLLWASASGIGTAEDYLKTKREKQGDKPFGPGHGTVEEYLEGERKRTTQSSKDLLSTAVELGYERMARELVNRGADPAHLMKRKWSTEKKQYIDNLLKQFSKTEQLSKIEKMPEFGGDQPAMSDSLGRKEFAEGLAALFLNPYVKPPFTVGITGEWGIGKSSLMIQTEIILLKTAALLAFPTLVDTEQFPGSRQIVPSQKGLKTYKEINKAAKDSLPSSASASEDAPLVKFLGGEYEQKYHAVYQSLALTDRNEMFRMGEDDSSSNQNFLEEIPSILTVRYNAWYYKNELEAWAGLAVEITKAIEESMTRAQRVRSRCRYAWREHRNQLFLELFLPFLLALFLSVWVAWAVWKLLTSSKHKGLQDLKYGSIPVTVLVVVWTVVRKLLSVFKPVSGQIMGYLQLPNHKTNLGYQDRVISDIKSLMEEIGEKPSKIWRIIGLCGLYPDTVKDTSIPRSSPPDKGRIRMIVFVDDLDRCEDKVILQVLSAVNLVLAACNINVVLGMDMQMITRAIEKEFAKNENGKELAEKYISKIVQLPLALPDTSKDEITAFLDKQLGTEFEQTTSEDAVSKVPTPTEQTAGHRLSSAGHRLDCVRVDVLQDVTQASESFLSNQGREQTQRKLGTMPLNIQMIIQKYSNEERKALHYLSNGATGANRLPREWKRFLTYHRVAWNILSLRREVKNPPGWETKLVIWVFCCWQWKNQIDIVIKNWKKLMLMNDFSRNLEDGKDSLKNIIEYYFTKIRLPLRDEGEEEKEREEWQSLIRTLAQYDVCMECLLFFQKFRLNCEKGYLTPPQMLRKMSAIQRGPYI